MGIEQLLQFVRPALQRRHISEFSKQRVAVDTMSWLYKACYGLTFDLNREIETHDYVLYIQKMVCMLKLHQIEPILVFDGRPLIAKQATMSNRRKTRQQNKQKGQECYQQGDFQEARKFYSRCIDITDQIFYFAIDAMKQLQVKVIIAPYEADAEVAYLVKNKICDFAITYDSDLITFGCERILLKLGTNGFGDYLDLESFRNSPERRKALKDEKLKSFFAFSQSQVIESCIMAGCDYLPSIQGIGIKTSVDLIKKYSSAQRTINVLKSEQKYRDKIPDSYFSHLVRVKQIFKYQTVFDPIEKKLVHYSTIKPDEEKLFHDTNFGAAEHWNQEIDSLVVGPFFEHAEDFVNGQLNIDTLQRRERSEIDLQSIFIRDQNLMRVLKQQMEQEQYLEIFQQAQEFNKIRQKNQFEESKQKNDENFGEQGLEDDDEKGQPLDAAKDLIQRGYRPIQKENQVSLQQQENIFKTLRLQEEKEAEQLFKLIHDQYNDQQDDRAGQNQQGIQEGEDEEENENEANQKKDELFNFCKFYNDYQAQLQRKEIEQIQRQIGVAKIVQIETQREGENPVSANPFLIKSRDQSNQKDSLEQIVNQDLEQLNQHQHNHLNDRLQVPSSIEKLIKPQLESNQQEPNNIGTKQRRKISEDGLLMQTMKTSVKRIQRGSDDFSDQFKIPSSIKQQHHNQEQHTPNSCIKGSQKNLFDFFKKN